MRLASVVETSSVVAGTRSRSEKTLALAKLLRDLSPAEVPVVTAWLTGNVRQGKLGIGWVALAELPTPATTGTLTVIDTDAAFSQLAAIAGPGSGAQRSALIAGLLGRATEAEQCFLRRLVLGELRQGALAGVLTQAVAQVAGVAVPEVQHALLRSGDLATVAATALSHGAQGLAATTLMVGRPLAPMLAGSAPSVAEAFSSMTLAAVAMPHAAPTRPAQLEVDQKLDGIRVQLHRNSAGTRVFTRSLDDITERVPELVEVVEALACLSVVLDGEAIALQSDGRPRPFQETGSRIATRIPARRAEVPLTLLLFDVLHLNGVDLLDEPLSTRRARLSHLVPPANVVDSIVTDDASVAQDFFTEQIGLGHEGVVIKDLAAAYSAGRRGSAWVKVKPRHTLDLVVLAVEWGSGRRTGKLSNIHLGARDPNGGFVMLGKTFKGMTDATLDWQTARFLELATLHAGHVVHVRPEQVVEIAFDGLQRSSRYAGGLALRFARVVRYRPDKDAAQADTIQTVRALAGLG